MLQGNHGLEKIDFQETWGCLCTRKLHPAGEYFLKSEVQDFVQSPYVPWSWHWHSVPIGQKIKGHLKHENAQCRVQEPKESHKTGNSPIAEVHSAHTNLLDTSRHLLCLVSSSAGLQFSRGSKVLKLFCGI